MEFLTVFMERLMKNKTALTVLGIISMIAPLYFLKTLYNVYFGPMEDFVGYQSEQYTWLVMAVVDTVGFLTVLPAREKGRIMQIVMASWSIEMYLLFIATLVR